MHFCRKADIAAVLALIHGVESPIFAPVNNPILVYEKVDFYLYSKHTIF